MGCCEVLWEGAQVGPLSLLPRLRVIGPTFLRCNQGNWLDDGGQYAFLGLMALFCALHTCDQVRKDSSLFLTQAESLKSSFKTLHHLTPSHALLSPRLTHEASWCSPNTGCLLPSHTLPPVPGMPFSCLPGESSLFLQYEEE